MSKWLYNLKNEEVWTHNNGEIYDTREECIKVAKEEAKMEGKDIFYIGIATPYERPVVDVEDILLNLEMKASEELPWETANDLYKTDEKALKDLENRIEKVFDEWLKENNINPSDSYVIIDIEECDCYDNR